MESLNNSRAVAPAAEASDASVVAPGATIRLTYTLTTEDSVLDTTEGLHPLEITIGKGQVHPIIERALIGRAVGEEIELSLDPSLAFGEIDPALRFTVSRTKLPAESRAMEVGASFEAFGPDRKKRLFRCVETDDLRVTIDGNHPFAGETIHISARVLSLKA